MPAHGAYCPTEQLEYLARSPLYELDSSGMLLAPRWHYRVFSVVQRLSWETAEDPSALRVELDSLFRLDSVALKWSLADLITDEFRYDESTAAIAAFAYAAFDFDATTLLARAQVEGTGPQRWRAVLQPLRAPLTAAEERVVAGFVCRAIPLLVVVEKDEIASMFPWFDQWTGEAVVDAIRLLSEPARDDVRRTMVELGYYVPAQ